MEAPEQCDTDLHKGVRDETRGGGYAGCLLCWQVCQSRLNFIGKQNSCSGPMNSRIGACIYLSTHVAALLVSLYWVPFIMRSLSN